MGRSDSRDCPTRRVKAKKEEGELTKKKKKKKRRRRS